MSAKNFFKKVTQFPSNYRFITYG